MSALRRLASRGYGWYLALKVGKALIFPVALILWVAFVAVSIIGFPLVIALVGLVRVLRAVPCDFRQNIIRPRWFTGFSRDHYRSLYGGDQ